MVPLQVRQNVLPATDEVRGVAAMLERSQRLEILVLAGRRHNTVRGDVDAPLLTDSLLLALLPGVLDGGDLGAR